MSNTASQMALTTWSRHPGREEARLTSFNIVRVHRTRLVNLARVSGLKTGANGDFELTLDTGQAISGSRRYRDAVTSIEELANSASVPNDNRAEP